MGRASDRAWRPTGRLGAATVLATAALGVMAVSPAVAQTSPVGEIGYGCVSGQSTCAIGSDGSNPRVISSFGSFASSSVLSPDGTRQSFTAQPAAATLGGGAPYSLYVASSDGTGRTQIWTPPGQPIGTPVWNRAGTELAVLTLVYSSPTIYNEQMWLVGADGSSPHQVVLSPGAGFGYLDPTWSPDGSTLAYEGSTTSPDGTSTYNLSTVSVAGGTPKVISSLGANFSYKSLSWSPDGTSVLAAVLIPQQLSGGLVQIGGESELLAYSPAGGPPVTIVPATTTDNPLAAYYSPDGNQIVVQTGSGISVAATDGSQMRTVLANVQQSLGSLTVWTAAAPTTTAAGYDLVASDGGVFSFNTSFYGSLGSVKLNAPIVGAAPTSDGGGYWLVGRDGGIFTFGDAPFYGSATGITTAPIVGITAGFYSLSYSLVGKDGSSYDADKSGSVTGPNSTVTSPLNAPIVGTAALGGGSWLVASDGGVFTAGGPFEGSMGGVRLNKPIVGMAADPATGGYWLVASDGGVFSFNAPFYGSMGGTQLNQPIVGITADPATGGYWLVASDGGVFSFNAPFLGSTGNIKLNKPIVGMTVQVPSGLGS